MIAALTCVGIVALVLFLVVMAQDGRLADYECERTEVLRENHLLRNQARELGELIARQNAEAEVRDKKLASAEAELKVAIQIGEKWLGLR